MSDAASAGVAALRAGNARAARAHFEQALKQTPEQPEGWLGLAFACSKLGDSAATLQAVERALQLQPLNLRALLFKGDHLAHEGQSRRALAAYRGALRVASTQAEVAADIRQGLVRAERACEQFSAEYERYLLAQLQAAGYQRGQSRFDEALDIAFGKAAPQPQQPTRFFFPGLAPIAFFEPQAFAWVEALQAQTEAMRGELETVLTGGNAFTPYLASNPDAVPLNDTTQLDSDDWGAYYFYDQGRPVQAHAEQCPTTFAALQQLPLPDVPGSTPHALFSRLAPHSHIPPHTGLINTRLICHLPLIVPPNCGALRCGNSERAWQEGQLLIFDDTIEHEAWNNSDQERVVLIFDIWRPDLSDEEQALISTMLRAVQAYEADE